MGLTHFTEDYADRFFGRDTECALVIGNLRAARLTLLYAESGVGKSSVLRAGVVARLRGFADHDLQTRGSPRLVPIVFSSWSEKPVTVLIRAIGDAVRPYLPDGAVLELPEDDLEAAIEATGEALDATLLIILDQFEEYFLYPDDRVEQKRVGVQVARCVNRPDLRANFLISIREDAYAQLGDLFRGRVSNVYGNFLHLDFLDRDGARESIEKPIERINELDPDAEPFTLEPALVDAVLDQVGRGRIVSAEDGHGIDNEPRDEVETTYLQLVMRRLWEEETGAGSHDLRLRTLENLGSSQAIIRGHLDRAMEDGADGVAGLDDDQRRVAASIFHFLVTSGGTKIALTARDLSDLSGLPPAEIDPVLQHLSSPRLHILRPVVSDEGQREPRFEIFHDALARPIVDWRTRVEQAELDARVKKERAKRERAQQVAADAERRAAKERKRKRLALALLGLAIVALLAGTGYFAIDQGNQADQEKAATQSVRAAERVSELSTAPTFGPAAAALASVEAYRLSPTSEARDQALAELQLNPGMPTIVAGHTRGVRSVAYWPDSPQFATAGEDGTVRLWDARGGELRAPLVNPLHDVMSVAVSESSNPITRLVAAGLRPGAVRLWTVTDAGWVLQSKTIPATSSGALTGLAFNPRVPTMLAAGGLHRRIALWDLTDPDNPVSLGTRKTQGKIYNLAFDASGRRLFTAGPKGGQVWKVSGSGFEDSSPSTKDPRSLWAVTTAPNGSFAFGGPNGVDVWDAVRGRELHLHPPGGAFSLEFAHGGSVLVSGGFDWNVTTWDVTSGRPFGPPRADEHSAVLDVAISPNGKTIAAAGEDRLVKLWPLNPTRALAATVGGLSPREVGSGFPYISNLAIGAHGHVAAAAGSTGTSIWKLGDLADTESIQQPMTRIPGESHAVAYHGDILAVGRGHSFVLEDTGAACHSMPAEPCRLGAPPRPHSDEKVFSLALSKYGHRLLLASSGDRGEKGILNLWDVTDTARTGEITHLSSREIGSEILQVAFSPASPLIAAGTEDGKLRVWDVSDPGDPEGSVITDARGNEKQPVDAVAFSPDGELLASGGGDQQVVLWKVVQDGSGPPKVEATPGTLFQTQTIFSIAFSPDGKVLAAGDGDGSTCLYEVENRNAIGHCLRGHSTELINGIGITSVRFAPVRKGGTVLLTAGTGQPIVAWDSILWNLSDDDRVDEAIAGDVCELAGRNLTTYEWSAIFDSTTLAGDRHKTCPQYPLP